MSHVSERAKPRIFFADRGDASFIRADLDLLGRLASIDRFSFQASALGLPLALVRAFIRSFKGVRRCDLVVCQFAGWNSWLPLELARLFGKASVLVVHGTDCVSLPTINYGNFRKWPLNAITSRCMRRAGRILPVHESLIENENTYATGVPMKQGIRAYMGHGHAPITVLHHGFDVDRWDLDARIERSGFLTVASGLGAKRMLALKGIDLLVQCARVLPEQQFTIVGPGRLNVQDLPTNVILRGAMSREELKLEYQRTRFYLQVSMSEGFGCALAEAMLCGCVPIVSSAGSLPGIVGETGYVLRERSAGALANLIQVAMTASPSNGSVKARQRIVECFPMQSRAEGWMAVLGSMMSGAGPSGALPLSS